MADKYWIACKICGAAAYRDAAYPALIACYTKKICSCSTGQPTHPTTLEVLGKGDTIEEARTAATLEQLARLGGANPKETIEPRKASY